MPYWQPRLHPPSPPLHHNNQPSTNQNLGAPATTPVTTPALHSSPSPCLHLYINDISSHLLFSSLLPHIHIPVFTFEVCRPFVARKDCLILASTRLPPPSILTLEIAHAWLAELNHNLPQPSSISSDVFILGISYLAPSSFYLLPLPVHGSIYQPLNHPF